LGLRAKKACSDGTGSLTGYPKEEVGRGFIAEASLSVALVNQLTFLLYHRYVYAVYRFLERV
jgi:hypothetical protein